MLLQLVTLDGVKFEEDAYSIVLPTIEGEITVLKGHMPLLTALKPGTIAIRRKAGDEDYKVEHFATFGGVADVNSKKVRILVDEATANDSKHAISVRTRVGQSLEHQHPAAFCP